MIKNLKSQQDARQKNIFRFFYTVSVIKHQIESHNAAQRAAISLITLYAGLIAENWAWNRTSESVFSSGRITNPILLAEAQQDRHGVDWRDSLRAQFPLHQCLIENLQWQ